MSTEDPSTKAKPDAEPPFPQRRRAVVAGRHATIRCGLFASIRERFNGIFVAALAQLRDVVRRAKASQD